MHVYSVHITGENTVNNSAWVHLVFSIHITGDNPVNSNACVYLVVFYAYYWCKHCKQLSMGTFSGFLCILLVKTLSIGKHGYILWFSIHITGENTVNSYAWGHLVVFNAYYR